MPVGILWMEDKVYFECLVFKSNISFSKNSRYRDNKLMDFARPQLYLEHGNVHTEYLLFLLSARQSDVRKVNWSVILVQG